MKRVITIWNSASTMSSASQTTDSERVKRATMHDSPISGRWTYWPRNFDSPSWTVMSSPTNTDRNSSTRRKDSSASARPIRNTDQKAARTMKAASAEYASASAWSGRSRPDTTHRTTRSTGTA